MTKNMSVVSLRKSQHSHSNSSIWEQDLLLKEKIESISSYINVMQSRVAILQAKIHEGNETQRENLTQGLLDITNVSSRCKGELNQLWNTIQNVQIKSAGIRSCIYNCIALPLLSTETTSQLDLHQFSNPGSGTYIKNILSDGTQLALATEQQKKLCYNQETEKQSFINQQHEVLELIADVGEKKTQISEVQEKQLIKIKGRIARTKIARTIINCFLSSFEVDFEQHPDLLEIKNKWRRPIQP